VAASTEQKLDYLLKKIGYTASKTGLAEDSTMVNSNKKAPFAESIPSPLVIANSSVWTDSDNIPTTPPGSDSSSVKVYLKSSPLRMTYDSTVSNQRSFIARSTYGNQTSAILGDWIDTQFGDGYIIQVYRNDPSTGSEGTDYFKLSAAGTASNDTWFFDYSSGVLNFNGTVVPDDVSDTNIYIVGYRYIGAKGTATAGINTTGTSFFEDIVVGGNAGIGSLNVTGITTFNVDTGFIGGGAGITSAYWDQSAASFKFLDNVKAQFGDSQDLSIWHNGTNSLINNITGTLYVQSGSNIHLQTNSKESVYAEANGQVKIYFNGNERLKTTGTGVDITDDINVAGITTVGFATATDVWVSGAVTATTFDGSLATTNLTGTITNAQLAGSIANNKLENNSVSYGGVELALGSTDATPSFDLQDATNYPYTSLTGIVTHIVGDTTPQLGGDLDANSKSIDGINNLKVTGVSTFAGDLTISSTFPRIYLTDTNSDSDFSIFNGNGTFTIKDETNAANRIRLFSGGGVQIDGNLDATAGLDVTGTTTISDTLKVGTAITAHAGVITATTFSGNLTGTVNTAAQPNITSLGTLSSLDVTGNVSIGGTLTYDDVTNVDSIGIITARQGIHVLAGTGVSIAAGGLNVSSGISTFAGDVNLGSAAADTITALGRFDSNLIPSTGNTRDLGTSSFQWKDLWIDGTGNIDSLNAVTARVGDLTDNRVVIAGASGELEDDANLTFNGSTLSVGVALNISGIATLAGITTVTGHTLFTKQLSVSGLSTYIGVATYKSDVFIDGTLTAGAIDGGTY